MQKSPWIMGLGLAGLATALLAAEDKEPGQTALEALDSNGDGVVSFVEFQDGDRNRLQEIDADRNGVLTIDEFLNARPGPRGMGNRGGRDPGARSGYGGIEANQERRARMREMMLERATEQFHAMDSDGDEVLTTEEFLEATFARMDRDADGVLSAAELQPPERRGPRRGGPGRPRGERGGQSPQA